MRALNPGVSVDRFWERVAAASRRALLCDYDGTLAPFRAERERACPYPGVREVLASLLRDGTTRAAVVSGRPARDVERLLGLDPRPEIWGSHGLERLRPDGEYEAAPPQVELALRSAEVCAWLASGPWKAMLERKPFGFALHARGSPPGEFARARDAALSRWRKTLEDAGLETLAFDGGIEWRPSGPNKGNVVETVLSQEGPDAALAYLGDDRTDEDAFAALAGRGLSVLVGPAPRPTRADLWIRPPDELIEFLQTWRRAAGSRSS